MKPTWEELKAALTLALPNFEHGVGAGPLYQKYIVVRAEHAAITDDIFRTFKVVVRGRTEHEPRTGVFYVRYGFNTE